MADMKSFVKSALDATFSDIQAKIEVYDVVRELVDDVELWDAENNLSKVSKNLSLSQTLNEAVISKMKHLQEKNQQLTEQLTKFKQSAVLTREVFVKDIGYFLSENKQTQKLKDKIAELETRLNNYALHGTDYIEPEEETPAADQEQQEASVDKTDGNGLPDAVVDDSVPLSALVSLPVVKAEKKYEQQMFLYDLDDEFLLNVFSYLDTAEVLHVAQICKYAFKRVVILFGIESTVLLPEWGIRPDRRSLEDQQKTAAPQAPPTPDRASSKVDATSTPDRKGASAAPGAALPAPVAGAASATPAVPVPGSLPAPAEPPGLTKEIIDVLIKKLTPAELMVIMSVAEKLKKQTAQVHALSAEKEDLNARLENTESVRNFLIDKLKAAETEIKSLMAAGSALKKQAVSDQEIIGYLDLRVNELEGQQAEYAMRCQQLQASLDLQYGSHSHKEQQLSMELNECRVKYEKLAVNSKAEKKVLIKEVKQLRAQVEAATNERNVFANQARLVREALAIGAGSSAGSGSAGAAGAGSGVNRTAALK